MADQSILKSAVLPASPMPLFNEKRCWQSTKSWSYQVKVTWDMPVRSRDILVSSRTPLVDLSRLHYQLKSKRFKKFRNTKSIFLGLISWTKAGSIGWGAKKRKWKIISRKGKREKLKRRGKNSSGERRINFERNKNFRPQNTTATVATGMLNLDIHFDFINSTIAANSKLIASV